MTLPRPDDFHVHFREGAMLRAVVVPSLFAVYLTLGLALVRRACRRAERARARV